MTIAYYHGSPGSYKTASMVQDWLIPARKVSRRVVTNIRGVEPSDTVQVVPTSDIIPKLFTSEVGTLFLIDELGEVFEGVKFESYIPSVSTLVSEENGKEVTVTSLKTLFDKHRHFNFDIIGTAPSSRRVPAEFKHVAEWGYKHKNLASLGFKGRFIQGVHNGFDSGESESHFVDKRFKKISASTFKAYQSTSSGVIKDSAVSEHLFLKTPFLIFYLLLAFTVWRFWNYEGAGVLFGGGESGGVVNEGESPISSSSLVALQAVPSVPLAVSSSVPAAVSGLVGTEVVMRGFIGNDKKVIVTLRRCSESSNFRLSLPVGVEVAGYRFLGDSLFFNGANVPYGSCPSAVPNKKRDKV